MKSQATPRFWKLYGQLPERTRRRAVRAYRLWQQNPEARGLYFKRVKPNQPVYAVRIDDNYRALGLLQGDTITWFWIGNHDNYEQLLKSL